MNSIINNKNKNQQLAYKYFSQPLHRLSIQASGHTCVQSANKYYFISQILRITKSITSEQPRTLRYYCWRFSTFSKAKTYCYSIISHFNYKLHKNKLFFLSTGCIINAIKRFLFAKRYNIHYLRHLMFVCLFQVLKWRLNFNYSLGEYYLKFMFYYIRYSLFATTQRSLKCILYPSYFLKRHLQYAIIKKYWYVNGFSLY